VRLGSKLLVIAGIIVLALPGIVPAFDHRFFLSHDGYEHVFRTLAVVTGIREGALVPRWTQELAGGFGYPLFAVYSPLAYLPPSLLTVAGIDILHGIKVDLAALCFASGVGAYLALRQIAGRPASFVAAAGYACAPYTLANAYVRLDLAELSTFPLTALVIAGFLRIAHLLQREHKPTFIELGPTIALTATPLGALPATHSLSLFTFLPTLTAVLVLAVVVGRRRLRLTLLALGCTCSLSVGLASWYLAPLVQWQGWIRLSSLQEDSHFRDKLLDVPSLLRATTPPPWNWFGPSTSLWTLSIAPSAFGELPASPAYLVLLAAVCALAFALTRKSLRGVILAFGCASLISCWLDTSWSFWFWSAIPRLTQLQFPWRLLGPISLLTALLAGLFVEALPRRTVIPVALLLCGFTIAPAALIVRPDYRELDSTAITWPTQLRRELQGGFGTTGSGLFLPTWVTTPVPGNLSPPPESATESPIELDAIAFDGTGVAFSYHSPVVAPLVLARLYAPPWSAILDGKPLALDPQPVTGFQRVELPAGKGHVAIRLNRTHSASVGNALSLVAAGLCAALLCLPLLQRSWFAQKSDTTSRSMRRRLYTLSGLAVTCAAALFITIHVPLILRHQPTWSQPSVQSSGAPIAVESWSIEPTGTWDDRPVLSVALFAHGGVTLDDDVIVTLRDTLGSVVAERSQRPRTGTFSTVGWPAGMLVEDHLLLPGPAHACGGVYRVNVAFRASNQSDVAHGQDLGTVTLPGSPGETCMPMRSAGTSSTRLSHVTVNGVEQSSLRQIVPGETLNVVARVDTNGPTRDDAAVVVDLVGPRSTTVATAQSYANLDLIFTSLWRQGGEVPLRARLLVPKDAETGLYRLRASLYDPSQDRHAPVLLAPVSPESADSLDLALFKIPSAMSGPATTLAKFGGVFALVNSEVVGGTVDGIASGDTLLVKEQWRLDTLAQQDFTLFVQVLDPMGKLVAQADGMPLGGGYPTSTWSVGEVVTESRAIALPQNLALGRYTITTGWYALTTGQRLQIDPAQPANAWILGSIMVTGKHS
jgi:hypothetical protein